MKKYFHWVVLICFSLILYIKVLCYLQSEKTRVLFTYLQKTTICIGLQAEQIFSVYINKYFFFNFGRGFWGSFSIFFQLLAIKNFWNNFYCIVLLFVWAQKVCRRHLKSYFKLEVLIFLSFMVSFSRYVQLRSSFSDAKSINGGIWDTLQKRSYQSLTWKSIKGKYHHWQLCKVVHNAKLQ